MCYTTRSPDRCDVLIFMPELKVTISMLEERSPGLVIDFTRSGTESPLLRLNILGCSSTLEKLESTVLEHSHK